MQSEPARVNYMVVVLRSATPESFVLCTFAGTGLKTMYPLKVPHPVGCAKYCHEPGWKRVGVWYWPLTLDSLALGSVWSSWVQGRQLCPTSLIPKSPKPYP